MRNYNIESDLKQEQFQTLKLVQGDRGNKIKINVYEDGQPVSLTGCSVTAKYKRADGEIINDGVIENIHDNSFDAVMDSSITKVAGTLKMLFTIEKDAVKVSAFLLLADVREGIGESSSSGGSAGGGEVTVDLTDYYKKIETYSRKEIDAQFKDIVNKTITTEERSKLSSLENYDDTSIKNDIQTQKVRIDSLATLKEGSTTGDAELIDGRIGVNATNYLNIGDAIRGQINEIITLPTNLWTFGDYSKDYLIGQTYKHNDYDITNMVEKGKPYLFKYHTVSDDYPNINIGKIICFAQDGTTRISSWDVEKDNNYEIEFTIPVDDKITKTVVRLQPIGSTPAEKDGTAYISGIKIYNKDYKKMLKDDISINQIDTLKNNMKNIYDTTNNNEINLKLLADFPANLWTFGDYSKDYLVGQTYIYKDYDITNMVEKGKPYIFKIQSIIGNPRQGDDKYIGCLLLYEGSSESDKKSIYTDNMELNFTINESITKAVVRLQTLGANGATTDGTIYYKNISLYDTSINTSIHNNVEIPHLKKINDKLDKLIPNKPKWIIKKIDTLNNSDFDMEYNNIGINKKMFLSADIGNSFERIQMGHGRTSYGSCYLEITTTDISVYKYTSALNVVKTCAHGLTIQDFINVSIETNIEQNATIRLVTSTGSFTLEKISWNGNNGNIFVQSTNSELLNVCAKWTCTDYNKSIHIYGDSYCGIVNSNRFMYYLRTWGYHTFLLDSYAGRNSIKAYDSLLSNLQHSSPKYIVWTLGMNDPDTTTGVNSNWETIMNKLISLCADNDIELILCTIPNVRGGTVDDTNISSARNHSFKNEWIRNSGYRYIDFCKVVGADDNISWKDGLLSDDGVHPNTLGAEVLASKFVQDFHEITCI